MKANLLLVLSLCCLNAVAQEGSFHIRSHGLSLIFWGATNGNYRVRFTSYDHKRNRPLSWHDKDGYHFNGEVRPRVGATNVYEAGYVIYGLTGSVEYGLVVFDIPSPDVENDGLPDILQPERAVSVPFTAQVFPNWTFGGLLTRPSFNGTFVRRAISHDATYTMDLFQWPDGQITNRARIIVENSRLSFIRGKRNRFDISGRPHLAYAGVSGSGSGYYRILNEDQVVIPAHRIHLWGGAKPLQPKVLYTRIGTNYVAWHQLRDGNRSTPLKDFTQIFTRFYGTSDADNDGIPDFSDLTFDSTVELSE